MLSNCHDEKTWNAAKTTTSRIKSDCDHFFWMTVFYCFKPVVSDHLTHGLIPMFAVTTLLRLCNDIGNYCMNCLLWILFQNTDVSRPPLGRDLLWFDSCKQPPLPVRNHLVFAFWVISYEWFDSIWKSGKCFLPQNYYRLLWYVEI